MTKKARPSAGSFCAAIQTDVIQAAVIRARSRRAKRNLPIRWQSKVQGVHYQGMTQAKEGGEKMTTREFTNYLRQEYPGQQFRARTQKGFGGYINLQWIDGPTAQEVCEIWKALQNQDRSLQRIVPDRTQSGRAIKQCEEKFRNEIGIDLVEEDNYSATYVSAEDRFLADDQDRNSGLSLHYAWFDNQSLPAYPGLGA